MDFMGRLFGAAGDLSTMRLVFVWTYGFAIVVPLTAWAYCYCIKTPGAADLPENVTLLVTGIVTVITTGKVAQYFKEKPGNGKPCEPAAQP
jgi:hypothetical protein